MSTWYAKAAAQKVLSALPTGQRLNRVLQVRAGSLDLTDAYVLRKWRTAMRHVTSWRAHHGGDAQLGQIHAVEVGTGWFPVTSIALVCSGVADVNTFDVDDLLDAERVRAVLTRLRDLAERGEIDMSDVARERVTSVLGLASGTTANELLRAFGVTPHVTDARASGLAPASVGLLISTSTLEHLPVVTLRGLLRHWRVIARDDAVMSHLIDCSDHFAHFDRTINRYNFLRYSGAQWSVLNSRLNYQNRLRASDYQRLHEQAGWNVVARDDRRHGEDQLASVPLHRDFAGYDPQDLRVTSSLMVSRPA